VSDRSESVKRRSFINSLLFSGVAAFFFATIYPIIRFLIPVKREDSSARIVQAADVGGIYA
jgi:hypothetical protein